MAGMLKAVSDIKPNLSGTAWRWSRDHPFPPIDKVMHTAFFTQEDYGPLRERLAEEAPTVDIPKGGVYSTIRTRIMRRDPEAESAVENRHSEVCFMPSPFSELYSLH